MIPKILHLYWDGRPMSYLQSLTVVSFKKHNPDWRIFLWMPDEPNLEDFNWITGEQKEKYTGVDYLHKVKKLCEVNSMNLKDVGIDKKVQEIQKSDLFRWYILHKYGGAYSDFDVLYIRPLDKLLKEDFDFTVSHHAYSSVAFYVTKPNQKLFKDTLETAKDLIERNQNDLYQALASEIFNKKYGDFNALEADYPDSKIINLPDEIVYPYSPATDYKGKFSSDIEEMFFGDNDLTTKNTIGIHWFNGHPLAKKYQNNFDEYRNNKSIISKYARDY